MNYRKDSILMVPCRCQVCIHVTGMWNGCFSSVSEKQIGVVTMAALAPLCPIRKLDKCLEGPSSLSSWWL